MTPLEFKPLAPKALAILQAIRDAVEPLRMPTIRMVSREGEGRCVGAQSFWPRAFWRARSSAAR
jgi:hypothetical protein